MFFRSVARSAGLIALLVGAFWLMGGHGAPIASAQDTTADAPTHTAVAGPQIWLPIAANNSGAPWCRRRTFRKAASSSF
ncbi:MAG: hypothetical protein R2911_00930 [Caldilineaceae bacterium]